MAKGIQLPDIPRDEQTPLVRALLGVIEQLAGTVQRQEEEIQHLKDGVAVLKGEKKRPTFKPSKLDQEAGKASEKQSEGQRPGSRKRNKTPKLTIHEDKIVQPSEPVPPGSRFKGYRDFVVQDLRIRAHTIRYRLARWVTAQGETLMGQLPACLANGHFGPELVSYLLYQHHHCQVTQPLLLEQLQDWGIEISAGQLNALLLEGRADFHTEKDALLATGLAVSSYVTVDDTGARHQGKNGYVTHIGNDGFAWFQWLQIPLGDCGRLKLVRRAVSTAINPSTRLCSVCHLWPEIRSHTPQHLTPVLRTSVSWFDLPFCLA